MAQVARTVRHTPEVMVKVSGGGSSSKAVLAHFKYLTRRDFEIETDDGQVLKGTEAEKELVAEWGLDLDAAELKSPYRGVSGRKPAKLVHNIVLSMPAGTPSDGLLRAARAFAQEEFALKHRYAMVLHTDQAHPHVHLVVRALDEEGKRLNIRKATLRLWRAEFARHLRAQGIAANATDRAIRGITKPRKRDGIYRAIRSGGSTHVRSRVESVAAALARGNFRVEPGKAQLLKTRQRVTAGWRGIGETLRRQGLGALAREVERFVGQMAPPRTERESIAHALIELAREVAQRRKVREAFTR
jgi:hypothetical protein